MKQINRKGKVKSNNRILKILLATSIMLYLMVHTERVFSQMYTNSFTGSSACPTNGNTPIIALNATGVALSRNTITCSATANVFNSSTLNNTVNLAATSYIEFSVTANAGYILNLSSLSFFRQASSTAPNQLEVRYSKDGFATFTAWGAAPNTPTTGSVALWDFTDFSSSIGGTVVFRIYPYGTTRADGNSGNASSAGTFRLDDIVLNGTVTLSSVPSPVINGTSTASPFTTTYGTASVGQTFTISASNLTTNLLATSVVGYEISRDGGIQYKDTVQFAPIAGSVSGTLIIRLKSTATVGGIYNAQNIVLSSAGANSVNISTASSGNIVSPLTITTIGAIASNKVYDGNSAASIIGNITAVGAVNGDVLSVGGSTGTFTNANVGTSIQVSPYLILSGTNASSYVLTQPILLADITAKVLNIINISANNKMQDGTTAATLSGAPALVGVISADISNVQLGGIYTANFTQANPGTAIPVVVSGYSISGTASGNYALNQPTNLTANITTMPLPVITSMLTASATYGSLATTYTITATNSPTAYTATGLPSGLTINTISGEISGTPTTVGTFTVSIGATNNGGTGIENLLFTIGKRALTVSGAIANNKLYDGTAIATISGSVLQGIVGGDNVTINGSGIFANPNVANGILVTSTQVLSGADATKYSLVQPTGLFANITPINQTITFAATASKTTADIDYLPNAISNTSGLNPIVYTSSNTSVASISSGGLIHIVGIGTTTITAMQTGSQNYNATSATQVLTVTGTPVFSEVILPQFIQGVNGTNNNRLPYAFRSTISNLTPNATYRYVLGVELTTASSTSLGVGNNIFPDPNGNNSFVYSTGTSLSTSGNYGLFTTNSTGSYTGWFIIVPTGNATRFVPGTNLFVRISLNDGNNGNGSTVVLSSTNTIKVINLVNASGANNGTGLRANSMATPKNFIFSYDNVTGNGRPLSGTFVEGDGATEVTSFASFYGLLVDGVSGAFGLITPNTNSNGVRRIEQRDFTSGAIVGCAATDADGLWPSGANTVNPTGGSTPINITASDVKLSASCASDSAITNLTICSNQLPYIWNGQSIIVSGTYTHTAMNSCGCDSVHTLNITIHNSNTGLSNVTACNSYIWNGTTYTASASPTHTYTNVFGCDSVHTLNITIHNSNAGSSSVTACNSYVWNGTTYTASASPMHTYVNAFGCDSLHTLNITIHNSNTSSSNLTACTFYTWNGTTYNFNASPTNTYTNAVGCDSVHTLNITIHNSNAGSSNVTACNSYTWNGITYTSSAAPMHTYTNAVGCDSVHTLNITIFNSNTGSSNVTGCNSYVWNGTTYTASASPMHTYVNAFGCDSLHTLNITIRNSNTGSSGVTACNSYSWNGTTYTANAAPIHTYTNAVGCDSLHTLNITIHNSNAGSSSVTSCNSYSWNGIVYTSNGLPTHTYLNTVGCDSIHTLNITIHNSNIGSSNLTACNSYIWNGITYTSSSSPTHTYINAVGCDSVHTLNITINNSNAGSSSLTACNSYPWNGIIYTSSASTMHTYVNAVGCDSVHTLNISINNSNAESSNVTACNSYTWNGTIYTSSASPTNTYTNTVGCDSVHTMNITIHNINTGSSSVTSCNSYSWNGIVYTSNGLPTHTYLNTVGCDSIHTLNITIHNSNIGSSNLTACNSYIWNGITYTANAAPMHTYVNTVGCDSVHTLNITINSSNAGSSSVTACNSYAWNGTIYTSSASPTHTYTNAVGCDSVHTLNITIHNSNAGSSNVTACNSYSWNGTTYTSSSSPTHTYTNAVGCDSIHTLNITINNSNASSSSVTAYNSYAWNGTTYTSSSSPTHTYTNAVGCDSVHTMNISINNSNAGSSNVTACNSYSWNGIIYTSNASPTHTYVNAVGCDSVHTLNITIHSSTSQTTSVTSCDSYTWACNASTYTTTGLYTFSSTNATGCVHTETLNLNISTTTDTSLYATACDSYTWQINNKTYATSGIYLDTITNTFGCTKIYTLILTIHISPTVIASNVSGCPGSPIPLVGSPAGGIFSKSNPYSGPNTTYTYTFTSANGCTATSNIASITNTVLLPPILNPVSVTNAGVIISWLPVTGYNLFNVRYKILNSNTWNIITVNGFATSVLAGLSTCSKYEVQVQTICIGGAVSAWSSSILFSTLYPPTLNAPIVSGHTAKVSWSAVPNASSFNYHYRKIGTTTWTATVNIPASILTKNITSLPFNNCYEFQIQSVCSNNVTSNWSSVNFCTATIILKPVHDTSTNDTTYYNLYPNPTENELHIAFNTTASSTINIKLLDLSGRLIKQVQLQFMKGENTNTIPVDDLARGMYIVQVYEDRILKHISKIEKK